MAPTTSHFPPPAPHDRRGGGDDNTVPLRPASKPPPVVLAIDIGATKFAAGLVSPRGDLVDRAVVLVDPDVGPETHFKALATIVEQQLEAAERHRVRLSAVGIGSAGPITRNCETVTPVNLPAWREFPLRARVRELTGKRVYGDLDGKALALAEGWQGAAKGYANYCVLTVSTGVGGAVVVDGELVDGASGNAGHVGHFIVDPNGRRCACGARGCIEAEASGVAIEAITGRSPTQPTYEIMERTGRVVGRGVASLCNLLDLELVVVGGGVALGFAATFFNAAQDELSTLCRLPYSRHARITPTRLGDRGPLIGAGAVAVRAMQRERMARQRGKFERAAGRTVAP